MDIPVPKKPMSVLSLVLLVVVLAVLALLALGSLNLPVSTTTRNRSSSCPGFDEQEEAFRLAQFTEQYRKSHPTPANYGLGSWTVCYTDGPPVRNQTPEFKGGNNKNPDNGPVQISHSEQQTYRYLQFKLPGLSLDQSNVVAVEVVIFSQVIVCPPCQEDMVLWQAGLREKARTENLFLSIWDIAPGKGFAPTVYPGGTGIPVGIDDLRKIDIAFTESGNTVLSRKRGSAYGSISCLC